MSELTMDVGGWIRDNMGKGRRGAVVEAARALHSGLYFTATSRYPLGTNVFDRDWDLLLVLDACRVDAMKAVAPEFDFVNGVDSLWSTGSSSHEWLCKTFTREYIDEISETIYLSTNPNSPSTFNDGARPPMSYTVPLMWADWDVVASADFKEFRQIHRDDYEECSDTVVPRVVTDHAIQAGRVSEFERMVIHYFQPHRPYIADSYRERRPVTGPEGEPWTTIRTGAGTKEEVWELYLDNLRLVLSSVERLLENIDAETVAITADHGDLLGEAGLYGHPEGVPHPDLKKVPWVETTAVDTKTSSPSVDVARQKSDVDTEERLRHLGYL